MTTADLIDPDGRRVMAAPAPAMVCRRCGHPVAPAFGGTWTHRARVVASPREYRHRIVAIPAPATPERPAL